MPTRIAGFAEGDLLNLRILGQRRKAGDAIDFAIDFRHHFLHVFDVAAQFGQDVPRNLPAQWR